jgi:zinc protease
MSLQQQWYRWRPGPIAATLALTLLPLSAGLAQPGIPPASAQSDPAPPAGVVSPYVTTKLDNGLEIIVIENHNVPLVTIDVAVRNGAFTEPDEFAGLSHLYEHMFFKANAVIPSQEQFMKRIRQLGITFNGYTSEEVVTYFFTLPSRNLDPGMKFMSDAIKSPLFKDEELVKEREVVLGEFDRNEAQPTFALRYALDSAMWMPYVSRKQALGQRMVIKTATADKMRMIQNRFYIPNNSALIISGDVKAKEVFDFARKYFSDWKTGPTPFPQYNPPAFPPLQSQLVVREAKIPDVTIQMVFRGPSIGADEPAPYVAQLISTLLRQPTSRFYHNLSDSGLVTGLYAGYSNARNVGDFTFNLDADPDKARQALTVLKQEIEAMGRPGYFSAEEIQTAKQIIADRSLFEQDNPFYFTIGTTAGWWSMASLDYYLNFPANVQKVTEADITNFINHYLAGRPFVLGIGAGKQTLNQLNVTPEALKWS